VLINPRKRNKYLLPFGGHQQARTLEGVGLSGSRHHLSPQIEIRNIFYRHADIKFSSDLLFS
jgi:hypothetical protein